MGRQVEPEGPPSNVAERLTSRGRLRRQIDRETVPLTDAATVRTWARELAPGRDQQILVHRSWAR